MSKRYFIETFGCQMNALDSEKIAGSFSEAGMQPASDVSEADVIILNTCSVRAKAVQKVYARLGEIKRRKASGKNSIVGVVGCMPQLEKDNLLKKAPFVKIIAGPQKGHLLGRMVELSEFSDKPIINLRSDDDPSPLEESLIRRSNAWSAYVTISEGCNGRCSFCVVPLTRGKERTRRSEDILREVKNLGQKGYVEITLLGQIVNSYRDPHSAALNFPQLLRNIAKVQEIRRIRFTSPHPSYFSEELLDVMVSCPNVCNHIHLPVQSGSSKILRAMNRGYTRESYLEIIEKIKSAQRPIAISTDIIVGFPGEAESDFEDTLSLLDAVHYHNVFSFKYSPRPHTAAYFLPDDIPEQEKGRRLDVLQKRQRMIQEKVNQSYLGQKVEVLVEGPARNRLRLTGRTSDNKIVNFDGPLSLIGRFTDIEVSGYSPVSLRGRLVPQQPPG